MISPPCSQNRPTGGDPQAKALEQSPRALLASVVSAVLLIQLYFLATAIASTVAYVAQLGPVSQYGQYEDGRDAAVCGPPKPTCCGSCTEHQPPLQVTACLSSCSEASSDEVAQCCPLTSSELEKQARTYLIVLILASSITVFVALVQLYCAFAHRPAELAAPPRPRPSSRPFHLAALSSLTGPVGGCTTVGSTLNAHPTLHVRSHVAASPLLADLGHRHYFKWWAKVDRTSLVGIPGRAASRGRRWVLSLPKPASRVVAIRCVQQSGCTETTEVIQPLQFLPEGGAPKDDSRWVEQDYVHTKPGWPYFVVNIVGTLTMS